MAGSGSRNLRMGALATCVLGVILALAGCTGSSPEPVATDSANASESASPTATEPEVVPVWSSSVDPAAIPLGDGAISTAPQVGSLFSCGLGPPGPGAFRDGPWIDQAAGTWDSTAKILVQGENSWPQATYRETVEGDVRRVVSDDLPIAQLTGNFPIDPADPAFAYDRNPNTVLEHAVELALPVSPSAAATPGCVGMGAIGILKNGVELYNAIDDAGRDAAAHEVQDVCDGHPDQTDSYHYHDIPRCILSSVTATGSTLLGYALDGYGIYVERDASGRLPTNADLDVCHGRVSPVEVDGATQNVYHYSASLEFPYVVGCFRGTPVPAPAG